MFAPRASRRARHVSAWPLRLSPPAGCNGLRRGQRVCACDRRREQEAHRLDGLGVCGQAGAGAGRGPQSYNARESYRSQTRESTQTPFVTGLVTPVRLYDLRTWQATCQGWLRGWLAAHFGPLRQRWRLAVPEVNPKWTQNDTFRPTSGPALLRPTSTHFGDIPRGRQMQVAGEVVEGKESVVHVPGETAYSPA